MKGWPIIAGVLVTMAAAALWNATPMGEAAWVDRQRRKGALK